MSYSNIYNIDFRALAEKLTPPFLRGIRFIDWLETLFNPLEQVNFNFKQFRKDSIYKVVNNCQVVYLEKVLNNAFDVSDRRIYIVDSLFLDPLSVYPVASDRPVYIYDANNPVYINDDSVFEVSEFDFIVVMPLELKPANGYDLTNILIQIRSLVNYYKLASKRFTIIWI